MIEAGVYRLRSQRCNLCREDVSLESADLMVKRQCLDCGALTSDTRCESCRLERNRKRDRARIRDRPSAYQRGYTPEYQANRARVLAASDVCWLCGHAGARQVDHVVPLARGGT